METKHTKGQWSLNYSFTAKDLKDSEGSIAIKSDVNDRPWIAEAKGSHVNDGMGLEEFEANAKLIAAAPELLEALKGCIHWMSKVNLSDEGDQAIQLAEKAIKKATT